MNWYWLNHMEVSPVSMNILARVKKEHGKDTYKKGLPQYLCFNHTISLLFSWQICIILPQKAFFLQLDLYWQPHSSVARLFSGKIIDNHFSINMDFTWLVTWSGLKSFQRIRIYRLKTCLPVIIIFITKTINQVLHGAVHVLAEIIFFLFIWESSLFELMTHIFFFLISLLF